MVFTIASLHLLYLNTRLLPQELRPPIWRRVALVGMSLFYGFFTVLSIRALHVTRRHGADLNTETRGHEETTELSFSRKVSSPCVLCASVPLCDAAP